MGESCVGSRVPCFPFLSVSLTSVSNRDGLDDRSKANVKAHPPVFMVRFDRIAVRSD